MAVKIAPPVQGRAFSLCRHPLPVHIGQCVRDRLQVIGGKLHGLEGYHAAALYLSCCRASVHSPGSMSSRTPRYTGWYRLPPTAATYRYRTSTT